MSVYAYGMRYVVLEDELMVQGKWSMVWGRVCGLLDEQYALAENAVYLGTLQKALSRALERLSQSRSRDIMHKRVFVVSNCLNFGYD